MTPFLSPPPSFSRSIFACGACPERSAVSGKVCLPPRPATPLSVQPLGRLRAVATGEWETAAAKGEEEEPAAAAAERVIPSAEVAAEAVVPAAVAAAAEAKVGRPPCGVGREGGASRGRRAGGGG